MVATRFTHDYLRRLEAEWPTLFQQLQIKSREMWAAQTFGKAVSDVL